jgi:hypothetical protein
MVNKSKKDTPTIKLSEVMQLLASRTKKEKLVNEAELPTVAEVLDRELRPGGILIYQEKDVVFKSSTQAAVKSLKVNIVSTESKDLAVLHQLHTQTRAT